MRVLSGAVSAGPGLPAPAAGAGQPRRGPHQHPRHREAQRTGSPSPIFNNGSMEKCLNLIDS